MNITDPSWENSERTEAAVPAILDPTSSPGACNSIGSADIRKNPKLNAPITRKKTSSNNENQESCRGGQQVFNQEGFPSASDKRRSVAQKLGATAAYDPSRENFA
jgi:hypothetical protein